MNAKKDADEHLAVVKNFMDGQQARETRRIRAREGIPVMLSLLEKFLILPAHLWVWILNKNLIPASVWDRLTVWRTRK